VRIKQFGRPFYIRTDFPDLVNLTLPALPKQGNDLILARQPSTGLQIK